MSNEVKTEEVQVVKKKGKPRGGNSPVIGNNGYMLEAGDNAKILQVNMALMKMPEIDLDDVEAVENRLMEYFSLYAQADMKPTVVGMAIALNGHSRQWLWAVARNGAINGRGETVNLRPEVANIIKKAYFLMENQWETYMNSGKINPVSGIFLGKNNYGYQDKTEYVLTPNQQSDSDYSADEIRERYIAADQQKRLEQGNSDEDSTSD